MTKNVVRKFNLQKLIIFSYKVIQKFRFSHPFLTAKCADFFFFFYNNTSLCVVEKQQLFIYNYFIGFINPNFDTYLEVT